MKTFEYKGDTFAVIEGEVWVKLASGAPPPIVETAKLAKKRGRKKGWKSGMPPRARKERARLEPDDLKQIKEMINAEYPVQEIATKYDVSATYVYNIKVRMKKDGELTLQP